MIRKAKPSEIVALLAITKACAAKMVSEGIYQWNEHYPNIEAFQKDFERDELFVLVKKELIIGCVTISTLKDEEYDAITWRTNDTNAYYIHRLAVHPDFQHCGNAKFLMDFVEEFAQQQKATSLRLDTFSKNIRNQQFYENRGYVKLGDVFFPKQTEFPFHCYELVL